MMDRYLLRYFLAVIDQGNFSRAASFCNVSQPTLSVGIAKLEAQLGSQLFRRTNRRVELTDAGANLASHARHIEARFMMAEQAVRGRARAPLVRLGVLSTVPPAWIERFLDHRQSEGTADQLEIIEARERDLAERLNRGRIDVALTILRSQHRFEQDALFSEGYSLALPISHTLAQEPVITAEALANDAMIVRRQCELLSTTSRHFTARGVRPFFAARTMSDTRALSYVRSGLGVTVMPDCFQMHGVTRARLEDFHHVREIGLAYAPHADASGLRDTVAIRGLKQTIDVLRREAAVLL